MLLSIHGLLYNLAVGNFKTPSAHNPRYIKLLKLLFSSRTHCRVWKLWVQRVGHRSHTLPAAIPGMHPHSGSGPQPTMWPPNVTKAQRHKKKREL